MTTAKKTRTRRPVTPPPVSAPAPADRPTSAEDLRIQVAARKDQADLLHEAACKAGYENARATGGRSAWILKVALQAAHGEMSGQLVTVAGPLAETLKGEAAADGLTVDAYLERAIAMSRAVRAANPAQPRPAVAIG